MFSLKLVAFGLFVVGNDFTNIPSPQKMVLNVARIFFYSFFSAENLERGMIYLIGLIERDPVPFIRFVSTLIVGLKQNLQT